MSQDTSSRHSSPLAALRDRSRSLRFRLVVTVVAIISAVLVALVALVQVRTSALAEDDARAYTGSLADYEAAEVRQPVVSGLNVVRTLASVLATMQKSGHADRADVNAVLRDLALKHPELVGFSSGWEPNAFDGKDALFTGKPGYDKTGRLIPYWFHDGDGVSSAPLTGYTTPGEGDWYIVPQQTGKETVVDPYHYVVGSEDVLMTTVAVPILDGDKVLGVATADIALTNLSEAIAQIKPYDTGYAALYTAGGTVVAHP
ncbi:MAG: cache domain-containing protein, partial [Nocardioidaceae bacterium]